MKSGATPKLFILSLSLLTLILVGFSPTNAPAKTYKWKLSTEVPPDFELNKYINEFCANIEKRTKGDVKIKHYNAGQLGGYEELFTVLKSGGVEMLLGPPDPGYDARLNFLFLPYIVTDMDQVKQQYSPDGVVWKTLDEILSEQNTKVVSLLDFGFFEVANNKRPVRKPEDCKGIKLRIMRYKGLELFYTALGASPIYMNLGEAITGLQTGVIDGDGSNGVFLHAMFMKSLFKYATPHRAFYESAPILVNNDKFEELPENYQKILLEEGVNLMNRQRQWMLDNEERLIGIMEEAEVRIERLTPAEIDAFIKAGRATWKEMESIIGKDLMDRIVKAVQ